MRDMQRAFLDAGCRVEADSGARTKWSCPCGQHTVNVPRHKEVSPGVVRSTIERLACLPEGWLQ